MSKKIFAMFLAIVLVLGTLPVLAISSAAEATKTNVALGKTATAGNGNTFASITDGATSGLADIGYWTKDGSTTEAAGLDGTCYVEIDLGENFDVYELRVVNYVDDSPRYYQWEAYATTDNTLAIAEWTKIGEKTDTAVSTAEGTTVAFDATAMRYIRVYGTFHSANVGYHFAEIFAYADVESTFEGDSGAVSDTINWAIDSSYNLTITGTGAMPDYAAETDRPWDAYKALAKTITVGEGVTSVGKLSFSHFTGLESISLSDTVTTLGYDCFAYDGTVPYLRMSKNVTVIKQGTVWSTTFTTISCYYDWKLFQMNLTELGNYNSAYGNATWVDAVETAKVEPASGTVNDTINWAIDASGNLTITGTGDMPDYAATKDRPWDAYKALATTVTVGEGITSVGKLAFNSFTGLESVTLSDTVTTLGYDSFAHCETIPYFKMSKNVTVIKQGTVYNTTITTISCYYDWNAFQLNLTEIGNYNTAYGNATWVDAVVSLEGKEVMPCGKYGAGMENWSNETQVLLTPTLNSAYEQSKFLAATWTLTFEGSDGSSKTVTLKPSSSYNGGTWGILRFQPCVEAEPENRFVPVKGVTYKVTFVVEIDGTVYTNIVKNLSLSVDPITHTFYEITWMVDGVVAAVNHCMEGKIPTVPEGLFEEYDEDGYHVMGAAEDPVPATADATYNVVSQRVGLTVKPWNSGYENWPGGTGGTQFQLLLCPDDYTGADLGLISNDAWKNYTFVLTINGTDYAINPSSAYSAGGLLRFETMLAEDKFTPAAGTVYTIYMTIYNLDGTVAYRTTTPAEVAFPDGFVPAYTCVGEHTYGEWVVVTYPTTTKEGERKHTCTVCGHEEPEAIAVIQVGDANGDGTISIADITAILDYLSVTEEEQAQMIADRTVVEDALDADGSGSISIADVTAVLEIIAGSAAEG